MSKPLGLPEPSQEAKVAKTDLASGAVGTAGASASKVTAEKRANLLAKVLRDKFYASAYARLGSLELVENAGFFDDGTMADHPAPQNEVDWLLTPVDKIATKLAKVESPSPGST